MTGRADLVSHILGDAGWLAHRYDPTHDSFHFRKLARDAHGTVPFLTDQCLGAVPDPAILARTESMAAAPIVAPPCFIFHSAYCASTLLARLLNIPGKVMALKEPVLLNDMVGWCLRGGTRQEVEPVLDAALTLLARPFAPGEALVIKSSTIVNILLNEILALRPDSPVLLLHAPLRIYLGSIARKGLEGRAWVRDLFVKMLCMNRIGFDFSVEDYLAHTDLQIAALGWLAQHAMFARAASEVEKTGRAGRICTLDSETFLARPDATLAALSALFALKLDAGHIAAITAGADFHRHSKSGESFDRDARHAARDQEKPHEQDIETVALWAEKLARDAGISLKLPAPLLP